jgi:hypothetical protein
MHKKSLCLLEEEQNVLTKYEDRQIILNKQKLSSIRVIGRDSGILSEKVFTDRLADSDITICVCFKSSPTRVIFIPGGFYGV